MQIKLLNIVFFAEDFDKLNDWYKKTLKLDVILEHTGAYNYVELGRDNKVILGITPASEVEHVPDKSRNNSCVMQLEVSDIRETFKLVEGAGGKILFGPSFEEEGKFYYGGIADIEENQIWIVEEVKK